MLGIPAWLTLRARDPRRLALGVLGAALLWLLVWYPNISGLPLPAEFAHLYQGLLPTWNYDFQFAVNTDPASDSGVVQPGMLIVGGITKLKHLYRDLVESGGGVFDYHDGYMTSGKQNLEARVKRSDVVICPVTCNSHGACIKVKRLCRKHNKTINMLPSASISAISGALHNVTEGAVSVGSIN